MLFNTLGWLLVVAGIGGMFCMMYRDVGMKEAITIAGSIAGILVWISLVVYLIGV